MRRCFVGSASDPQPTESNGIALRSGVGTTSIVTGRRREERDRPPATISKVRASSWLSQFIGAAATVLASCGGESSRSIASNCVADASCTDALAPSPAESCVAEAQAGFACAWDAGCHCIPLTPDMPPVANIRFQVGMPQNDSDYPYGPGNLPAQAPPPGSTVYLSSDGSVDPEGGGISVFWNVQDPDGNYLSIDPAPDAPRASFAPPRIGTYSITLEVTQLGGLRETGQATLALAVEPSPCAPDGVSPPCADGLLVPGGDFTMGSPAGAGNIDEHPEHPATVAPFLLDKYEVTVGRFRRFLSNYGGVSPAEGAGANSLIPGSGWQSAAWMGTIVTTNDHLSFQVQECGGTWTAAPGANEARPITCVTWYQAFALCIFEGKRLPTEEEWEYAAAGGNEERTYPWGESPPTPQLAVYGCLFDGVPGCSDADLPAAGSLPAGAGRWGHLDLAGSVWEWTLDMYGPYTTDPCDNCADLTAGVGRVFRGGDYQFEDLSAIRRAARYSYDPASEDPTRGFRCAQSIADAGGPLLDAVAPQDAGALEAGASQDADSLDAGHPRGPASPDAGP